MKFANIDNLTRSNQYSEKLKINIGDYMQLIAIDNLYRYMGISSKDIVHMKSEDLATYKGEKLILPINFMIAKYEFSPFKFDGKMGFSEDIIPVFIGLSFKDGFWEYTEQCINYLKKYEPIGCRDYFVYQNLKNLGVDVYLAGCITATLPTREEKEYDTVFFVDAPAGLKDYIPNELYKKCKFIHHELSLSHNDFYDRHYGKTLTENILNEYRDNAKLVITSRLHCALPCMALGIPVILVKEYLGYPFDLTTKFLPFYTPDKFNEINWEPKAIELNNYKDIALRSAAQRIMDVYKKYQYLELHDQYSELYSKNYVKQEMPLEMFFLELKKRYKKEDSFKYAFWGVSSVADKLYDYIQVEYPNAVLVKVIDTFRKIEYKGCDTELPDVLNKHDDFITIVTTINCAASAKPFFDGIGKKQEEYICVANEMMEERPK